MILYAVIGGRGDQRAVDLDAGHAFTPTGHVLPVWHMHDWHAFFSC